MLLVQVALWVLAVRQIWRWRRQARASGEV
jgi:hypothetical protein